MKIRCDIVWFKESRSYAFEKNRDILFFYGTFAETLRHARKHIAVYVARGHTVNLYLHRKDGKLRKDGERTYPRRADPRRSKG